MDKDRENGAQTPESIAEKQAVALKYNMGNDRAPRVVAKGRGYTAENIMAAAQSAAVPVYQNKTLVNMLMAIDIDREIPPELYRSVAEVMAHIYRIDKERKRSREAARAGGR